MPTSEKQRRAGFAELSRRKSGGGKHMFEGMDDAELKSYLHEPLHKKGSKSKKRSGRDQAKALRSKPPSAGKMEY